MNLAQIVKGHLAQEGAAHRMDGEQAVLGERLQRLADRGAAQRQAARQAAFGEGFVRRKLA
ncbi:hypothetical protein ACVIYH_001677 [Bradyrhizobium diazoefficiens]